MTKISDLLDITKSKSITNDDFGRIKITKSNRIKLDSIDSANIQNIRPNLPSASLAVMENCGPINGVCESINHNHRNKNKNQTPTQSPQNVLKSVLKKQKNNLLIRQRSNSFRIQRPEEPRVSKNNIINPNHTIANNNQTTNGSKLTAIFWKSSQSVDKNRSQQSLATTPKNQITDIAETTRDAVISNQLQDNHHHHHSNYSLDL